MTSPKRSEIYKEIFDDDEMLAAFGKLNPTVKERTAYFFDRWMDWRNNRLRFSSKIITSDRDHFKEKLKQIGLRDLWDYQFRNNEIRFKDKESLAFFKIVASDIIVEG
jgi:hypothetical protein